MRLVTFEVMTPIGPFQRLGALLEDGIVDLNLAYVRLLADEGESQPYRLASAVLPPAMREFLECGPTAMKAAKAALDHIASRRFDKLRGPKGETIIYGRDAVRLRAPLPNPNSLRDFNAFEQHVAALAKKRGQTIPPEWYKMPVYYKGNHRTIIGPDEDLIWPPFTRKLDYELELACIIGREGKDVPEERAHEYIAGYTIMNDFSARDIQAEEMACRMGPAKGKDFGTAIGPCIVTPDEVADLKQLKMIARVNGEVWSEGFYGSVRWTFPQMIAHVSRGEPIFPGDIFGSGTIGGGCGLELDRWLKPGDVVELEIQPIGVLRNRIVVS